MATASPLAATASLPVSIDDIRTAAGRIAGAIVRTPTLHSQTLSQLTGAIALGLEMAALILVLGRVFERTEPAEVVA